MSVCPPSHLLFQSKPICDPGRVRVKQRWLSGWVAIWPFHFVASSALPSSH